LRRRAQAIVAIPPIPKTTTDVRKNGRTGRRFAVVMPAKSGAISEQLKYKNNLHVARLYAS